jgi:hypothetical protein
MSTAELQKRLIDKIQKTENQPLLEEAFRLLQLESEDFEVYILTDDQKNIVQESRQQIKSGEYQSNDQVNNEIDEWLKK